MTTDPLAQQLAQLRALFTTAEPAALRGYIATSTGRPMTMGTTTPTRATAYSQRPSGLIVPARASAPGPLDGVISYLTASDVLGFPITLDDAVDQIKRVPLVDVLGYCAHLLTMAYQHGASRHETDQRLAYGWFEGGPLLEKVLNLLQDPTRGLLVPQAVMLMARLALIYSPDAPPTGQPRGELRLALLAIAESMGLGGKGGPATAGADLTHLGAELVANQHFNRAASAPHELARFVRRWRELPQELLGSDPQVVDLEAAYLDATGVPFDHLALVGSFLWAHTANGLWAVPLAAITQLGLTPAQIDAVLQIIAASPEAMRKTVKNATYETEWSFDVFGQWPVLLTDGGPLGPLAVVIDPRALLRRVFGWLPIWDIRFPPRGTKSKRALEKAAAHAQQALQHLTEIYTLEVLENMVGAGPLTQRLYDDAALQRANGRPGQRIADAVIDYPGVLVVVEVNTTQLHREAAHALNRDELGKDIDKLVEEVDQIAATIDALREDESVLTGSPNAPRRFLPLLVLPDGFPVNPITLPMLRQRVADRGLLLNPDTLLLEVLDVEELEMAEALQEAGGPTLLELLLGKQRSNFRDTALREYVLLDLRLSYGRSQRLDHAWERFVLPVMQLLDKGVTQPGEADGDGPQAAPA